MKTNRFFYTIVMLLTVLALSLALLPTTAQDDWPEGCELPDLEEAMSAAEAARAEGDVVAFVERWNEANRRFEHALSSCLEMAVLVDVDLSDTDFWGAYLAYADLEGANLQGANLREANLQWAYLSDANLQEADLVSTNLSRANLVNANLEGASLGCGAKCRNITFGFPANLQAAIMQGVNLQHVDLDEVNLQDVDLSGANLQGAFLGGVNLANANLANTNLQVITSCKRHQHSGLINTASGCTLELSYANLQGAKMEGADLWGANLVHAILAETIFDETTVLPDAIWDIETQTYTSGYWTPDTDMARFTDPEHPDFWDPCVELEEQPWYCEDGGG